KSYKIVYLVALTAAAFSMVGCRKGLQGTTPLPGWAPGRVGEEKPSGIIGEGTRVTPRPLPGNGGSTGLPLTDDMKQWVASAEQPFKADTVYFDFDKSTIKASETPKLDRVANEMKQHYKSKGLRIEGHCDERGT